MDWSMMGWDLTRDGELQSCVYDTQDYDNYACSDFVSFAAAEETATDGMELFLELGMTVVVTLGSGGLMSFSPNEWSACFVPIHSRVLTLRDRG